MEAQGHYHCHPDPPGSHPAVNPTSPSMRRPQLLFPVPPRASAAPAKSPEDPVLGQHHRHGQHLGGFLENQGLLLLCTFSPRSWGVPLQPMILSRGGLTMRCSPGPSLLSIPYHTMSGAQFPGLADVLHVRASLCVSLLWGPLACLWFSLPSYPLGYCPLCLPLGLPSYCTVQFHPTTRPWALTPAQPLHPAAHSAFPAVTYVFLGPSTAQPPASHPTGCWHLDSAISWPQCQPGEALVLQGHCSSVELTRLPSAAPAVGGDNYSLIPKQEESCCCPTF